MFRQGGVVLFPADGGFIIAWTEKQDIEESPWSEREGPIRRVRSPWVRREAVRTSIEETLKLASDILKSGKLADPGAGESYVAEA